MKKLISAFCLTSFIFLSCFANDIQVPSANNESKYVLHPKLKTIDQENLQDFYSTKKNIWIYAKTGAVVIVPEIGLGIRSMYKHWGWDINASTYIYPWMVYVPAFFSEASLFVNIPTKVNSAKIYLGATATLIITPGSFEEKYIVPFALGGVQWGLDKKHPQFLEVRILARSAEETFLYLPRISYGFCF